jgi:hypothetical protein
LEATTPSVVAEATISCVAAVATTPSVAAAAMTYIGGAGGEALHPGVTVYTKEVVVVGAERAIIEYLRPEGSGVAGDQRAGQRAGVAAVGHAAAKRGLFRAFGEPG